MRDPLGLGTNPLWPAAFLALFLIFGPLCTRPADAGQPVRASVVELDVEGPFEVWRITVKPSTPVGPRHYCVIRAREGGLREPRVVVPLGPC